MFKCLDCGHLFEDGEQARYTESHGESYDGCPLCGGAYEDTKPCTRCGSEHLEDDLYHGICLECLGKLMTVTNMIRYLEYAGLSADFFVGEFFNSNFDFVSDELLSLARGAFMSKLRSDELLHYGEKDYDSYYAGRLRDFITSDYGIFDFAEWVKDKGVKK